MIRTLIVTIVLILMAAPLRAEPFSFIALGDAPYGDAKTVFPPFEKLIATINARKPAFVVHVGDTRGGTRPCSDAEQDRQLGHLNSFDSPVIYTPGDNEWTDCHRTSTGSFDPLDRLARLRQTYFAEPDKSLGGKPMPVESQATVMKEEYAAYPENVRFQRAGIHFITAHVVGSNNNFEIRDRKAALEFFDRNEANIVWLNDSFNQAIEADAKAVVLFIHADMFEFDFDKFRGERFLRHSGFGQFGEALVGHANFFEKPVLLVFGDSHIFRVVRPFRRRAPNLVGLEVYGWPEINAVEVMVDPDHPSVFAYRSVNNPQEIERPRQ